MISKHPFHSITFVNSILHQVLKENQLRHVYSLVFCILLCDRYQDLMDKGEDRKKKLEDSIQRYSLLRDAHELESWINDKV